MSTKSKDSGNWVDRLVTDPAAPPQLHVLSGYRGRAAGEDSVRLYQQADLSSWVDVPAGAVLHESEATDSLGLTRTFLWVKAETALAGGSQGTATGEGWLAGPIATALGQETGYAARAHQRPIEQPQSVLCQTMASPDCVTLSGSNCPTNWRDCPPATARPALCPTDPHCPGPMTHDCGNFQVRVAQPRTTTQLPTGIDPRCPSNVCTVVACQTSWGPLCPNPPQPRMAALEPEAAAFGATAACPQVTQFCPQPTHFCPPSLVCPPRTTLCPTNFCPTNAQVCATLTAACNTLFCPTQHATCPPSFGGGLCPTMVCDPFGGR
jgi:hypothetical protein